MQIFLTSHIRSSSHISLTKEGRGFTQPSRLAGFTLIELLISVAIIGIITAIVLLKYSSFDSTTLLKGAAYEVALALREAQVKSVSVLKNGNDLDNSFNYPYGVTFTPGQTSYTAFRFTHLASLVDSDDRPRYVSLDSNFPTEDISMTTLERSIQILDVCVIDSSGETCSDSGGAGRITRLDVSFKRPEFTALFYAEGYTGNQNNISRAQIKLRSTKGTGTFVVEVSRLGQITVEYEE